MLFRSYSFGNLMLIFLQKPEATRVAGFNTWKKLGRFVKKGEKGIMVIAPCAYTYKKEEEGVETVHHGVKGFKAAFVFDVSQTDGEPIPEEEEVLVTDEYEGLRSIEESLERLGYTIDYYEESHGEHGHVSKKSKVIHVHDKIPTGQKASTLLHEWAHLQMGRDTSPDDEEIIVQTASYFIMARLGLDTSFYTARYVESWSNGKKWAEISKLFTQSDRLCKKYFAEVCESAMI